MIFMKVFTMGNKDHLDPSILNEDWKSNPRWKDTKRNFTAEDVVSLRNSLNIEYSLSQNGSKNLWNLVNRKEEWVSALGALSGNQAVQMAKAGLEAIYLSGWQVAADSNLGDTTYPDQSLYPSNSAPNLAKKINNALLRAEQVDKTDGIETKYFFFEVF